MTISEPRREKTGFFGLDPHKPGCTARSLKLQIYEVEARLYYPCRENKGADQVFGRNSDFPMTL